MSAAFHLASLRATMKRSVRLLFACLLPATTLLAADPVITVPFVPFSAVEQDPSPTMAAALAEVRTESHQAAPFSTWQSVPTQPDEFSPPDGCEIAFIPPRPLITHDFRYAVMLQPDGELWVLREGGLDDVRKVFRRPAPSLHPDFHPLPLPAFAAAFGADPSANATALDHFIQASWTGLTREEVRVHMNKVIAARGNLGASKDADSEMLALSSGSGPLSLKPSSLRIKVRYDEADRVDRITCRFSESLTP